MLILQPAALFSLCVNPPETLSACLVSHVDSLYIYVSTQTADERHRLQSVAPFSGDWCLRRSASYPVGIGKGKLDTPPSSARVSTVISRDVGFHSRLRRRVFRLRFSVIFSISSSQIPGGASFRLHPLPSTSLPIHYSLVISFAGLVSNQGCGPV